jgi:hypothetical protein
MGDLPKPPDDATWSDVEQTFFDAAPPEEFQPVGQVPRLDDPPAPAPERPRTQIIALLRSSVAGARRAAALAVGAAGGLVQRGWRGGALVVVAAGTRVRDAARAGAEGLVAAVLSIWCVDRRRLAYATAGVLIAAGLSVGFVTSRGAAPTNGAIAERVAPATGPTIAEAAPAGVSPSELNPPTSAPPSADARAPRAGVTSRRSHAHRRSVSAAPSAPSAQRPMVTAFMDRETYWAHETRSAPARSSRSYFSR